MAETFTTGQRWISDTEPELGLGMILRIDERTVELAYPACGETRTYARMDAPLTRLRFAPGDRVEGHAGWSLQVSRVEDNAGLLIYHGIREDGSHATLGERELSNHIRINRPQERLFSGQLDDSRWFDLRYRSTLHWQQMQQSPLLGLGGARTELLPHQLYIAHEVGRRLAPRVLLADEVGLGKTIEACLILHRQILSGRVKRVLIIVPESLLHQWLVELRRRFNLPFSLFDETRCEAIEASGEALNPFETEQWVLCSLDLLCRHPRRHAQALEGAWDMLIVDEAHHLAWQPGQASEEYRLIEQLAQRTAGVLLLTATPEQLGRAGHFARLRLLDPDRFHDLETFEREEADYALVAEAVALLLQPDSRLDETAVRQLLERLDEAQSIPLLTTLHQGIADTAEQEEARSHLIDLLLDRHGTGRVLFRNSRQRIRGFPQRRLHAYPLPLPEAYHNLLSDESLPPQACLQPEQLHRSYPDCPWHEIDPRIDWLVTLLRRHAGEKMLLICAQAETALDLSDVLRQRHGIQTAVFHERMSIIERDRAAAWFADPDEGCPLLVCSEIGSEGRNFQFTANLILFDLPFDPDLLEQRIGRLDRIGQRARIEIHIPYFEESGQAVLLRWLDEGLGIFEHTCPAGQSLFHQLQPALLEAMDGKDPDPAQIEQLIDTTAETHRCMNEELQRGRDQLLEINSCREPLAGALRTRLQQAENTARLQDYLENLLALFGVEIEEHSPGNIILRPGNHMLVDSIPGLLQEGMTCTFERATALTHEDRHYLTWEHPLTRGCMEMVANLEQGRCSAATLKHPKIPAGTLLLEMLFVLECPAPRSLQVERFLPVPPLRLVFDQKRRELADKFPLERLQAHLSPLDRGAGRRIVSSLRSLLATLIDHGETLVGEQRNHLITEGIRLATRHYGEEIERLTALRRVNPNVREEEIRALQGQLHALHGHLKEARMRLDALRLIVTT